MDVERLPSGKFTANALVLELAMIAFNLLRMIGQECAFPLTMGLTQYWRIRFFPVDHGSVGDPVPLLSVSGAFACRHAKDSMDMNACH